MSFMSYGDGSESLIGCDFGVPLRAGDRAKKIILVEAAKVGERHYKIEPDGRNERLVGWLRGDRSWPGGRAGWTLPALTSSLAATNQRYPAAMDFAFGIPRQLLCDRSFAAGVGSDRPFERRIQVL